VEGVDRLATLSHELSNLLDGSMRWLAMARREIRSCTGELFDASVASKRLDVVQQSLERMAGLIDGAMRDAARGLGKPGGPLQHFTLGQSVRHAVDVLTPRASAEGIAIELAIDERAAGLPTGPLYTPLLNGVRNAVDAVERASRGSGRDRGVGGRVWVEVAMESSEGVPGLLARIRDTGTGIAHGIDPLLASETPRPGGLGIGLALSTTIVEHAGGWLALANTDEGGGTGAGAVLQFWVPLASLEVSDGRRQG
jgi:signal transduction histidine kinase